MTGSLLSVDVAAAIRKLTDSQLSRPEMRSVELLRSLFQAGATRLDIQLQRDELRVDAPDAVLDEALLGALVGSADPKRAPEERYASLLELESRGGLIWLALCTGRGLSLTVQLPTHRAHLDIQSKAVTSEQATGGGAARCRVVLRRRTNLRDERKMLQHHARFSRRPVWVDGTDIRQPPPDPNHPLSRRVSGDGHEGFVRLRVDEDYSCIRWIHHEILDAERYSQLAGGVAHAACVYCERDRDVRERAVVAVRDLRESTVSSLHDVFDDLEPDRREAAREVMFARAIERSDLRILGEAQIFDTVGGARLSVGDVVARASRGPLEVTSMARNRSAPDSAIFLDTQGRRLVTELLRLPISHGSGVADRGWLRRGLDRAGELLRDASEASRWTVSVLQRGRALAPDALTEAESQFLREVQRLVRDGQFRIPRLAPAISRRALVEMVPRGRLPLHVYSGRAPKLQLPRSCPALQRVIRVYSRDPTTIYPALDMMFAGRDGWGSRRHEWRHRFLQDSA